MANVMTALVLAPIAAAGLSMAAMQHGGVSGVEVSETVMSEPELPVEDSSFVMHGALKRLDGSEDRLEAYLGRVVLVVNTASRCGYTRQYAGLETIYREHKDDGFVVLGFPSNDFGRQEPGSNEDIAAFCSENYEITFPMFDKTPVLGDKAHYLYQRFDDQAEPIGVPPKWNFTKFLIGRDGRVLARFNSGDAPEDDKVLSAIRDALDAPSPDYAPDGG